MRAIAGAGRRSTKLPTPSVGEEVAWVQCHLGHLALEPEVTASPDFRGGQSAADVALASIDVTGWPDRLKTIGDIRSSA